MNVTKGLIIKTPYIDQILTGLKTWEMRSTATQQRERIALIRKSSGTVIGTVRLVGCTGPLSRSEMLKNLDRHGVDAATVQSGAIDAWKFAWVMSEPNPLPSPVKYRHPSGAVIWVNLDEEVSQALGPG